MEESRAGDETPIRGKAFPDRAYLEAAKLRIQLLSFQRRTQEITRHHGITPERHLLLLLVRTDGDQGTPIPSLPSRAIADT